MNGMRLPMRCICYPRLSHYRIHTVSRSLLEFLRNPRVANLSRLRLITPVMFGNCHMWRYSLGTVAVAAGPNWFLTWSLKDACPKSDSSRSNAIQGLGSDRICLTFPSRFSLPDRSRVVAFISSASVNLSRRSCQVGSPAGTLSPAPHHTKTLRARIPIDSRRST